MGATESLRLSEDDYDFGILHPAMRRMYEGSDFYNFGYWRSADGSRLDRLKDASARLVELHYEVDADHAAVGRVLDVACGLGACTQLFSQGYPNAQVTGVNYSAQQIEYATKRYADDRVSFRQMNACDLGFDDDSFDRVHCVEAAMHFRPRSKFLAEACRVLAPGGRLFMTDILADEALSIMPEENVLPTAESYTDAMQAAGFTDVEIRSIGDDVLPFFAGVLNAHAMRAFARGLGTKLNDYVLVSGRKPG
ncbi:Erythromycin 3''-O-methyltransferase [Marinibacterium anthonyi]|nr:Erythromycin 3''-O-methyltransferase [Marinibacterium anthonyi]